MIDYIPPQCVTKEHIEAIARISSNNDETIIRNLTEIYTNLGKDCMVVVNNEIAATDRITYYKGAYLEKGYLSPYFVNDPATRSCRLSDGRILVTDYEFNSSNYEQWIPHVKKWLQTTTIDLVILAKDFDDFAVEVFAKLAREGGNITPMRGVATGDTATERLRDIAKLCGTRVKDGIEELHAVALGSFETIIIGQRDAIIKGSVDDQVLKDYIDELEASMAVATSAFQKSIILERIASLRGGWAIYDVGGNSSLERKERYDRVVDAKFAVRNAMHSGIVAGGSRAIICAAGNARLKLPDGSPLTHVATLFLKAVTTCYEQLFINYGYSSDEIAKAGYTITDSSFYKSTMVDIHDINREVTPEEVGLFDPYIVIEEVIKTAISVAGTLISTNYLIIDSK